MKRYKQTLKEYVDKQTQSGHVTVSTIVERFMFAYPEIIEEEKQSLILRQLNNEVRSIFSSGSYAPATQLFFEGMELPAFIAVRHDKSETTYIRTNRATLADLEAGEAERTENVANAQGALEVYRLSVDRVRPIMAGNPNLTVDDALAILAGRSNNAA